MGFDISKTYKKNLNFSCLQNQVDKMRVGSFCVLFCALIIFPSYIIEATPWGSYVGPGCPCVSFTISSKDGVIGNCLSMDQTNQYWCYVRKECRNCEGRSGSFPQYCKNYSNCRLAVNINSEGAANPDD